MLVRRELIACGGGRHGRQRGITWFFERKDKWFKEKHFMAASGFFDVVSRMGASAAG